jgi:hypothetical protein
LVRKRHRVTSAALSAIAALMVQLADFDVSVVALMLMADGRIMVIRL